MSAADSSPNLVGQVLGDRYRITKKLGEGGMGEVYAAEHVHIDKKFAIKLLKPEIVSNQEAVVRFQQEARSSSSIKHRNIIAIEDFGKLPDGRIYMCMELLNGQALNDMILQPQSVERLLNILIQTGHGLAAAHARNIVHRDMKPENIFVTFQGERGNEDVPKILDFGIAKVAGNDGQNNLTRTGTIFGTPFYMAPEQALGNPVDARTDIYAMGVIMYEVFAGSLPFQGESFMGILTQHITTEPEPVAQRAAKANRPLPPGLADIIMRCMQKNPAQRFNTMDELVQALIQVYRGVAGAGMSTYMEAFPHSSQNTPGPMSAPHFAPGGGAPMGMSATVGVGAPPGVAPSGGYPPPPMSGGHHFTPPPPSGSSAAVAASASGVYDPSGASSSVVAPKKSSAGLIIAILAVLAVGGGIAAVVVLGGKGDKGGAGSGSQVADNGSGTKDPGSGGPTTNNGGSGTTNNGGGSATTNNGGGSGTVTNNGGSGEVKNGSGDTVGSGEGSGEGSGKTEGSGNTDGSGGTVLPPEQKMVEVPVVGSPRSFEIYEDGQEVPIIGFKDHVVKVPEGGEIKITVKAKGYQDKEYTVTSSMRVLQVALKANSVPKNPNGNGNPTNVNTGPKCSGTATDLSKNAPAGCRQKFCATHTDPRSQAMCAAE